MKLKSSGNGSKSRSRKIFDFSYLMWNSGLCGLSSLESFCGDDIFGPCDEEQLRLLLLLFRVKINVGRFCANCFFDGRFLSDGGIGFSNSSCFIQLSELYKWFSRLWELTLLLLVVWRMSPVFCGVCECGSFCGDDSVSDS